VPELAVRYVHPNAWRSHADSGDRVPVLAKDRGCKHDRAVWNTRQAEGVALLPWLGDFAASGFPDMYTLFALSMFPVEWGLVVRAIRDPLLTPSERRAQEERDRLEAERARKAEANRPPPDQNRELLEGYKYIPLAFVERRSGPLWSPSREYSGLEAGRGQTGGVQRDSTSMSFIGIRVISALRP
jgi:hypothetical protein